MEELLLAGVNAANELLTETLTTSVFEMTFAFESRVREFSYDVNRSTDQRGDTLLWQQNGNVVQALDLIPFVVNRASLPLQLDIIGHASPKILDS